MEIDQQNSTELTDERIDQLVDGMERPSNNEIPMTSEEKETPEASTDAPVTEGQQTDPAQNSDALFEFQHSGKTIKATKEQLIQWARMGYDYPSKAQRLNQQLASFEKERTDWEKKWSPYKKVDEWASQNPQAWQTLKQQYEAAVNQAGPGGSDPTGANLEAITARIQEKLTQQLQTQLQPLVSDFEQRKIQQEDEALNKEIQGIREKHKDLPWDDLDEEGKSLEAKVIEHAVKNGIQKFTTAFRDYYHDQLIERERAQAKLDVTKGIQQKTKMGVLSESKTPKKGFQAPKNVKEQSYEDLMREALAEVQRGA